MKFKVGDRVMGNEKANKYGVTIKGWTGTVTQVYESHFCAREDGDTCNYPLYYDCFDLVNTNQTITIYRKDRDVIATMKEGKKVIKSGKATCNPSDTFDFEYGAKLAFARLMGMEAKKLEIKLDTEKFSQSVKRLAETLSNLYKPSFDWSAFKSGKFAVHCDTEEKARKFLKECDEQGIIWNHGKKASSETMYDHYGKDTCYSNYRVSKDRIGFSPVRFFQSEGITIIDYAPSVREVKRPAKVGEWIKIVNEYGCHRPSVNNGAVLYVDHLTQGKAATSVGNNFVPDEYVVLENYKPEEPKPFKKAKVGDKIKVVKDGVTHKPAVNIGDIQTVNRVQGDSVGTEKYNWFYDKKQEYIIIEKAPEIKMVNREAEVGEYVEIIKCVECNPDYYSVGDICRVVKTDYCGVFVITKGTHPCNCGKGTSFIYHQEYVVLEGYREGKQ